MITYDNYKLENPYQDQEAESFCEACQTEFNAHDMEEYKGKDYCPECLPVIKLVDKIKTFGYSSFIATTSEWCKGLYLLPLDLNNPKEIAPSKFGVSFDEFRDLLWEYKQTTESDMDELFESNIEIFKIEQL